MNEKQIEEIIASKNWSPETKAKIKSRMLETMRNVQSIVDHDYGDSYGPQDDNDGIPTRTIEEIEAEDKARFEKLKAANVFSPDELIKETSSVSDPDDVNHKGLYGYTALHIVAGKGDEGECRRLISMGADVDAKDNSGKQPWQHALRHGHVKLADMLRQKISL